MSTSQPVTEHGAKLSQLRCAAACSTHDDAQVAIEEACTQALASLNGTADLAVMFTTHHHRALFPELGARVARLTGAAHSFGATAETVIANGQEWENSPTVAVWLAQLPNVNVRPVRLRFERSPDGGAITGWSDELLADWPPGAALLLLGEPYTFPADALLEQLNEDRPGIPVIGGMASGAHAPGQNRLWLDGKTHEDGAVGVVLDGAVAIEAVVSQGCRPIGQPLVITQAERNIIGQLGGLPALARFQEMFQQLTPQEQQLAQRGLHVGRVTDEYRDGFQRGDFLVRNVIGADPKTGGIAVGDYVRVGQTVQFHVRDGETADEDLRSLLAASHERNAAPPAGALLFTCNGRGTRLFAEPHHDAATLRDRWNELPIAGLFAQGEMGPIAGANFVHGFTASIALLRPVS
jgi:small ligand-binding sensory domain FIST